MYRPLGKRMRLAAVGLVGVVCAALALALAFALDTPTASLRRDPAPVVGGAVVDSGPTATATLPPLSMIIGEPVPQALVGLTETEQLDALRRRASASGVSQLLQLGSAEQRVGNQTAAALAYRDVLRVDTGNVAAAVGLAMVEGAGDAAGLRRAEDMLGALQARYPGNPLVAFNRGWLAIYRRDGPGAVAAWRRVIAINPASSLGRTARTLLTQLTRQSP